MKKLLIFSVISILFAGCGGCGNELKAQWAPMLPSTALSIGGATKPNGDSLTVTIGNYKCASLQCDVTRVSSSMLGVLTMQESDDGGVNWITDTAGDTVHISNAASQVVNFTIAPSKGVLYHSYKITWTPHEANDTITVKSWMQARQ